MTLIFYPPVRQIWATAAACILAVAMASVSEGATLQSLLAGGSLTVGNSQFSQWELVHLDATAAVAPNLSLVQVNPVANDPLAPAILVVGGSELAASGINAIDMILRYRVNALAGSNTFMAQTLDIASLTFGGSGEVVYVSSELSDGIGNDLGAAVVNVDHAENVTRLIDTGALPAPKSQVFVTMSVFISGTTPGDSASLGSFLQRFAQNAAPGEPGDYNQNGVVDAADYTVWRDRLGAPAGTLPNDTVGGTIDADQYNLWKTNYGNAGSGAGGIELANLAPEPAAGYLLTVALLTIVWVGRGRLSERRHG